MVTKEVDSRSAKEGDRFKLRVNSPVLVDGVVAVPVGATAWGQVTYVNGTGVAGSKGRLSAKLLYIDLPGGPLAISGSQGAEGKANTAGLVIGVVSLGLLGLLIKGGNAHFKAGDILTGYISPPAQAAAAQWQDLVNIGCAAPGDQIAVEDWRRVAAAVDAIAVSTQQ
jgi:hypothetical protein